MKEKNKDQILFLENKKDVDLVRKDVEILMRTDLNLSHKQDMLVQKMDHLTNRINDGVSKTAWKTHQDVQEIKTLLVEMKGENKLRDDRIGTNTKGIGRFTQWAYWLAFVGIGGGLVTLAFSIAKDPPW